VLCQSEGLEILARGLDIEQEQVRGSLSESVLIHLNRAPIVLFWRPQESPMAESHNPYESPAADLSAVPAGMSAEQFTQGMVTALHKTRPWVRFLSVLGFVGCGLAVLVALLMLVMGIFMPEFGNGMGVLAAVLYLFLAVVWFVPALSLHRYANSITRVVEGPGTPTIEDALEQQRSFWRIVGIMTLVMLGLYVLAIFVGVIAGIVSTLTGG
jgi:hypothetical protein